ncbi:pilus assembly PilX family protein [Vitreoscilla massiliensis]|uniref:pilus assembly PilX family protein n=1 Tax=Vitreoscilla massiliensis TaxID=1689272 RepID=UPI00071E10C4|nr:PilX N-terminal domain-containing pilus assembly protein [Vitreoscilla massiliensis]
MRQSIKQKGFTLYMVLVLMAIIAILVLVGGQVLNSEMRLSTNDADRKFAFSLAEDTLKSAEADTFTDIHKNDVLGDNTIKTEILSGNPQSKNFFDTLIGSVFKTDCEDGKCSPAIEEPAAAATDLNAGTHIEEIPAWERKDAGTGKLYLETNGREYNVAGSDVSKKPRYIVEFLGLAEDGDTTLYRVTARAWGRNANTQVTLQSVIRVENKIN